MDNIFFRYLESAENLIKYGYYPLGTDAYDLAEKLMTAKIKKSYESSKKLADIDES